MTYSQHIGIAQGEFTPSEDEEIVDAEDNEIAEEEVLFGPPQPAKDDHIEHQVDVSDKVPNHHSFLCLIQKDQEKSGA
jgi:hypothetical protein